MPRVKRGTLVRKRHNKVLKAASGYFGGKHRLIRSANEQVLKSGNYAYRDRRNRKREFRRLWITRISAACRANGMSYNRFIEGMRKAGIAVDRKVLADLAVADSGAFGKLVAAAAGALSSTE